MVIKLWCSAYNNNCFILEIFNSRGDLQILSWDEGKRILVYSVSINKIY